MAAVLSLTLGIGANTTVFSLLDAILLESLPVSRPRELVRLAEENPNTSTSFDAFTYPAYDKLRRESRTLSGVIGMSILLERPGIEERGERRPAFVQMVSDDYFDVLGVSASRGDVFHPFTRASPGEAVAVISDVYWRQHYAAETSALGARFRFRDREFTVAGIAPPEFRGTEIDVPADIWVSIEQVLPTDAEERTRFRILRIMGRLRPGETRERAEAEANAILERPVKLQPGATGYSTLRGRWSRPLLLLELLVGLVLLITCANLANLVLAGAASRERELAIRQAIGASRSRLVGQLFTESLVLSAASGALGLAVAYWMSAALLSFLPPEQGRALVNLRFEPDLRVLGFAVLLSLFTSLLSGLIPALRATRTHGAPELRANAGSGQPNRRWMSRGLVISEVVMCTLLLMVAGVFQRSLWNLRSQETGYQEDRLLVADVEMWPPGEYSEARRDQSFEELRERAAALPRVEIAAFSHVGQLSVVGRSFSYGIRLPGSAALNSEEAEASEQRVSPGFLAAMGTGLVAGRDVNDGDTAGSPPVALVNEAFVRRFRLENDPVGQRFIKEGGSRKIETIEIVGVVKDARWVNLREEATAMYYVPYRQQSGSPAVRFAIRARGDLDALATGLIQIAQAIDRQIVLKNVVPFRDIVNRTLVIERLIAQVSAAFGLLGLLIAAIGLYSVVAYSVVRRRREIGVRIAVGASPGSVEWMVLRESLAMLGIGFAIGVPAAVLVTRLVSSMLFGLSSEDPATIAATMAVLTVVTVAAAYLPARRAAGTDATLALREE